MPEWVGPGLAVMGRSWATRTRDLASALACLPALEGPLHARGEDELPRRRSPDEREHGIVPQLLQAVGRADQRTCVEVDPCRWCSRRRCAALPFAIRASRTSAMLQRLAAGEVLASVRHRDDRPGLARDRARRLHRRVAEAHDEDVLSGEAPRVCERVAHLALGARGHVRGQAAGAATSTDREHEGGARGT